LNGLIFANRLPIRTPP